jgi:hypothetical protein
MTTMTAATSAAKRRRPPMKASGGLKSRRRRRVSGLRSSTGWSLPRAVGTGTRLEPRGRGKRRERPPRRRIPEHSTAHRARRRLAGYRDAVAAPGAPQLPPTRDVASPHPDGAVPLRRIGSGSHRSPLVARVVPRPGCPKTAGESGIASAIVVERGAIAQLGERLAGSQKVTGSSPVGSIAQGEPRLVETDGTSGLGAIRERRHRVPETRGG